MRVIKNEQKRRKIRQAYLSKKKAEDLSKKRKRKEEKEADEEKKAYLKKKIPCTSISMMMSQTTVKAHEPCTGCFRKGVDAFKYDDHKPV